MTPAPKLLTHCPLCNTAYGERSIQQVDESNGTRLYHLTCTSCAHAVLAIILEHPSGVSSIGLVTDLEAKDALRFRDASAISSEDCLNAHDALMDRSREICEALTGAVKPS